MTFGKKRIITTSPMLSLRVGSSDKGYDVAMACQMLSASQKMLCGERSLGDKELNKG